MAKGPVARGLGRAEALSEAGEYAAALHELEPAVLAEPGNAAVHTARGWALENLGPERLAEARAAYETALGLDPSALWAKEGLSNVLRRMGQRGDSDRLSLEVIEEGRKRYEREEDLRELVGWCELRLGRPPRRRHGPERGAPARRPVDRRRFDLALALLCAGDRARSFLEYSRGVHQAVNGGVERIGGCLGVALDDLEESLTERPALAGTRESIAARDLLRSTIHVADGAR